MWRAIAKDYELVVALLAADAVLRSSRRRGVEWEAASELEGTFSISQLRTIRLGRGEREYFFAKYSVRRLISGADCILFGGWESPAYWQTLLHPSSRSKQKVGFYESTLASNRYRKGPVAAARAYFYRSMDAVVVPGIAAKEAVRAMGVSESRIMVGFNAVDVGSFARAAETAPPRDGSGEGHNFIYVGQLIERKNVTLIAEAFAKIARPMDRLIIAGGGPQLDALRRLIKETRVSTQIEIVHHVSYIELPQLLAQQHTLVLASEEEVWGLVVNEALAAGCQAVVSKKAGVAASVGSMNGVFLADPTLEGVREQMILARDSWLGRIRQPEILSFTPEAFAGVFIEAFEHRTSRKQSPDRVTRSRKRWREQRD